MASLSVLVPEALNEWVQRRIESGEYASASDYVRDLIRRDQDAAASPLEVEDIRRSIAESRASGLTRDADDVFDRLEERLRDLAR